MAGREDDMARGALGLVAGMIIGAGVALIVAPQSGESTRRDILYYSKRGRRKARRVLEDCSDAVTGMVDTLGETATTVVEKGKDAACGAKRGVLEAFDEGQDRLRQQRRKLERLIG